MDSSPPEDLPDPESLNELPSEDVPPEEDEDEVVGHARGRVGHVLKDKWTIDRLVGVGGMAVVYAATHRNGSRVAIKMLHPRMSWDKGIKQRFLREGYAANKVGHQGAVAVYDDDIAEDGSAFLVMELLEGEPINVRMERKGGKLPVAEVLSIADQLLETLVAAHEQGIVHRDLKPENLFLTRVGTLKVLDFGIARLREISGTSQATQAGSLVGTPAFMAPEQARGKEVDHRSDLWAAGATMFNMLTGRFVHEAETVNEALAMAVTQHARSVSLLDPDLPRDVVDLIDRALEYQRDDRWPSARDMQTTLRAAYARLTEGASVSSPRYSLPEQMLVDVKGVPSAGQILRKPQAATTGRGMSASIPSLMGTTRSWIVAAGAAFAVTLTGLFLFFSAGSSSEKEEANAAHGGSPAPAVVAPGELSGEPAATTPRGEGVRGGIVAVDELPVAPEPEEQSPSEAAPATSAKKPAAPPRAKAPQAEPAKKSATTAEGPAPAKTTQAAPAPAPAPAPAGADDPFSNRY